MEHRRKSLDSETLNIDGNHLILKHWSQGSLTKELFDFSNHNLPFGYFFLQKKNAKLISSKIGKLVGIDRLQLTKWVPIKLGKYMRMKVEIEANLWIPDGLENNKRCLD